MTTVDTVSARVRFRVFTHKFVWGDGLTKSLTYMYMYIEYIMEERMYLYADSMIYFRRSGPKR